MEGSRSIANRMRVCVQLDRYSRLYFETNRIIIVCLLIIIIIFNNIITSPTLLLLLLLLQLLSMPTWIITRICLPNNLLMSSLAANSSWRRIFDTIRCCEGDWQRSSASRTNPPLSFFHPRCTTMSSYGISWFRKWNTFSRMISFACSSWLRFVITPGEKSHLPGRAFACNVRKISLIPCPLSAERLMIEEPSSLIPSWIWIQQKKANGGAKKTWNLLNDQLFSLLNERGRLHQVAFIECYEDLRFVLLCQRDSRVNHFATEIGERNRSID